MARFDGGTISSDGGALLLRQTDRRLNLLPRLAECFLDGRNPERIEHSVVGDAGAADLRTGAGLRRPQRSRATAAGSAVRRSGGARGTGEAAGGQEHAEPAGTGHGHTDRYKKITFWKEAIDELLVKMFIESHAKAPEQIVLDVDTTDLPLHGKQEGRFFHGYYDSYCYLPLYIFCGEHVLCARLRESNHDAAFGSLAEIRRIVAQIRAAWPEVKIMLRGDSGFCRNELMSWCEDNRSGLRVRPGAQPAAAEDHRARRCRKPHSNGSRPASRRGSSPSSTIRPRRRRRAAGSGERRVVAKAEHIDGKENPRFVVTSLSGGAVGGAGVVRRTLLRPRRHGEPHQGAVQSCSPIASAPRRCGPIKCGCICQRWLMCW